MKFNLNQNQKNKLIVKQLTDEADYKTFSIFVENYLTHEITCIGNFCFNFKNISPSKYNEHLQNKIVEILKFRDMFQQSINLEFDTIVSTL